MAEYERAAIVEDGKIICPWCRSAEVVFEEDVSFAHDVKYVRGSVFVVDIQDVRCEDDGFNQRIHCNECSESSNLPENCVVEFK